MHSRRVGLLIVALLIVSGTVMFSGRSAEAGNPCYTLITSSRDVSVAGESGGVINGTAKADRIVVNGDNNVIYAGSGNDSICVIGANNVVYGGPGSDYIYGTTSAYGESGNDLIDVWDAEVADGGPGNDSIYFETVGTVNGGSGGDFISGYEASDVYGDSGGDDIGVESVGLLDCGSARDQYYAGADEIVNCEIDND